MNIIDLVPKALIYFLYLKGGQWFETGAFYLGQGAYLFFEKQQNVRKIALMFFF